MNLCDPCRPIRIGITHSPGSALVASSGMLVCNKCDQIETNIQHFRRLVTPGMEPLSLAMVRSAIESLEADRAALMCKSIRPK